ncbi:MAG TPA: hypothetical protein VHT03_04130 [Rhizomicrobium sp.]|jgi:hypothetical protein|nr:hypothetical protein [Rhizomicrobium sp.]
MKEDDGIDAAAVAALGSQVLKVLDAETVTVALHNGNVVEGSFTSFAIRKKTRKGEASVNGKLSVETDAGVLEMDFANIASVKPKA